TALFNPDGSLNIINSNGRQEVFAANVFVQFIDDPWAITAEYSPINSEFYHLNTLSDYVRNDGLAYYLQVEYHFTPKHEALLRYDVNLSDKSDPDGKQFEHSLIGEVMHFPAFSQYAKDSTLGYAYRPNADWLFRLEFHNVEGTTWLSFRENADPAKLAKYWNMALAQLSYRF
ncbi:MAG TPA: hypothetical protein VFM46_06540, partial [Pseudomonadales bacterium]|nr:hypothetical protein [Pseudomonadales bacterium]